MSTFLPPEHELPGHATKAVLRPGVPVDAEVCGRVCYQAFATLADRHGFPADFPSPEVAVAAVAALLAHPGIYSVVAELDGRVVGSNFLDERSAVAGVGPVTVAQNVQDAGVGRALMVDVMRRAEQRGFPGVRLLQAAYHNRSLSLYAKLGFQIRETVLNMQGEPPGGAPLGHFVRRATTEDLRECNRVCRAVHGHDRAGELRDAVAHGAARVVEHDGRITGYTTNVGFFGHSVAMTNEGLEALIATADEFSGPGLLVPGRNDQLVGWCLRHGMRIRMVTTLMTVGLYNEPFGAYLPSILY
ncbi:acetyltransferase (GNAT) family protein [Saccharopolyspora erythraea NRRL 2338]|uniref:Acetyltransferase (GNAT) family n=2 Tax=Saccharopolyspora erythraea TaxID=1836 RepID=A4F9V9_SACEN|nr:GNAT family N-acetyltransferase [Saccharopolyspora erythraea]EQD83592.1 acetyltransferase [Saccharopolyspora erythraea D]PFG94622.1 acetyltransferase (GNAT) family protein [Saccharopolyspora erythraea NRRL 2338]QRK91355.1 GNAT family N-acetyltransferase [Saccharopolyspora erythraea]CAM00834.1 acetyltransferase (GNAT) family [Saccharopolyspora erythraea NRRL 2338]